MAVVYIVILIGVLVFIHEFGHYLAARIFNVKVLSFSIGFGPKLFKFVRWDTSWEIRLLPLGGFVQMYGTEFEEVTDREDPDYKRAYNNKPIWQKAIINFAGPLFNLLLPIPLLFCVYLGTSAQDYPSTAGLVLDGAPASGVLLPGDRITEIAGHPVKYWYQVHDIVADNPKTPLRFVVERDGATVDLMITPDEVVLRDRLDVMKNRVGRIGVTLDQALSIIGISDPNSPAYVSGLRSFDEITSVNGTPVRTYVELEKAVKLATGDALRLTVLRPQKVDAEYGSVNILVPDSVTIAGAEHSLDALGIASAANFITQIDPNSPASKAGLADGDQIIAHNGQPVSLFRSTLDNMAQEYEKKHTLTVRRNGTTFDTEIQLERLTIVGEFQEDVPIIYAGMYSQVPSDMPAKIDKPFGERIAYSASQSVSKTVDASMMLVVYLGKMIKGDISTKNLGGPILLGHMAKRAGEEGIESFMSMMAMVSINLGIINLFPIPLLDGGKLVILLVEAIKRGPISMRARQIIAYIGLAMVAMLMLLAFKNDIERLWNLLFD